MRSWSLSLSFIFALIFAFGCDGSNGNYLVKTPPPSKAVQQKVKDLEGVTFTSKVDILFVIDDSDSMNVHQERLATNLNLFIDAFATNTFLDYHIGVVTTDMVARERSGKLVGTPTYVERSTPQGLEVLRRHIMVGTRGSFHEQLFEPVVAALSPALETGHNVGFYRPDAFLAVIFITDAEDHSAVSPDLFVDFLYQLKNGDKEKVITYGVYVPSGVQDCKRDSIYDSPVKFEDALAQLGALKFSLCDEDYGTKLANLGIDLADRVGSFIAFNQFPDVRTIEVSFGTQIIPNSKENGWTYDSKKVGINLSPFIKFEDQPPGTQLNVTFMPGEFRVK